MNSEKIKLTKFDTDFEYQGHFSDLIRRTIGPYLIRPATFNEDVKNATDFVAKSGSIAARVRRISPHFLTYLNEFTIRCSRPKGTPTELEKILKGNGDWMFYAYGHEQDNGECIFISWVLIDLCEFRQSFHSNTLKYITMSNSDGSSDFIVINIQDLPKKAVIEWCIHEVNLSLILKDMVCDYCLKPLKFRDSKYGSFLSCEGWSSANNHKPKPRWIS